MIEIIKTPSVNFGINWHHCPTCVNLSIAFFNYSIYFIFKSQRK